MFGCVYTTIAKLWFILREMTEGTSWLECSQWLNKALFRRRTQTPSYTQFGFKLIQYEQSSKWPWHKYRIINSTRLLSETARILYLMDLQETLLHTGTCCLNTLKKDNSMCEAAGKTGSEMLSHFAICTSLSRVKQQRIGHISSSNIVRHNGQHSCHISKSPSCAPKKCSLRLTIFGGHEQ